MQVRVGIAVAAAAALVFASMMVVYLLDHPSFSGDTPGLVAGAAVAKDCLGAGVFFKCGTSLAARAGQAGEEYRSAVRPWPPFQYLIAVPLLALGMSQTHVLLALSRVSVAAFVSLLALFIVVPWRMKRLSVAPVLVAIVFAGPLLSYGDETFGEMLACALTVAAVAAVALRAHPILISSATCLAGLTKETAPFFAIALGLIVALKHGSRHWRSLALWVVLGGVLAFTINSAFNLFRYGTIRNVDLLAPAFQVPNMSLRLNLFGALLVSPNGGILEFWALPTIFLGAVIATALLARPRSRTRAGLAVALLGVIGALLVGLADWYAPFGWSAWGPRLLLPWVPAFVLVAAEVFPDQSLRVLRTVTASPARMAAAVAVFAITALPQIGVLYDTLVPGRLLENSARCPNGTITGSTTYYNCLRYTAWRRSPALFDALHGLLTAPGVVLAIALCGALGGLAYLTRELSWSEDTTS